MFPRWYYYAKNTIIFSGASLLALALTTVILWLAVHLFPALVPFIIALFLSFLMEPLINVLQSRARFGRGLAVLVTMLIVFGVLGTVITLLSVRLVAELISLSATLPDFTKEMRLYVEQMIPDAVHFYGKLPGDVIGYIQEGLRTLSSALQTVLEIAVTSVVSFISLVPDTVLLIIVTLLSTYFIAKDRRRIADFWKRLIPAPYGETSINIVREVLRAFLSYLKAQSILVTITMIISIIGLQIIGAQYALTMGLLVGLFDVIPVLGPATLFVPWAVWMFIIGDIAFAVKLSLLYLLILVTRQLLEARVVAANLGLNPLATLMAMYIGFKMVGFIGLILGPLVLIAVQAAFQAGDFFSKGK